MAKCWDSLVLGFAYLSVLLCLASCVSGWGVDGHAAICNIAQSYLNESAAAAVKQLLPRYAEGDLGSVCSWADRIKFRYHWSSELHYINVPDGLCTFQYQRDCKDENGVEGRCVAGAIYNYTTQLLGYKGDREQSATQLLGYRGDRERSGYNLTEALLFLSHLMGDIHQPLHVGHTGDRGGNTIDVHWYRRKTVLHHVWDDSIIETAEKDFYDQDESKLVDALKHKIETEWQSDKAEWANCPGNNVTCPGVYASESIKAACDWAYKGVTEDSVLADEYFNSRLPIVNLRLAQGAVRLAATLNRIFQ